MIDKIRAMLPDPCDPPIELNSETLEFTEVDKECAAWKPVAAVVLAVDSPFLDSARRAALVHPLLAALLSADGVG